MNKFLLSFLPSLFLFFTNVSAQAGNALSFDGIDDNVTVPSASTLIAGSAQFSMTCWIYPMNAAPVFPDYDGFCGFRNDVNADFYLVQTDVNKMEARFRNDNGVFFDILDTTLQLNMWQHYALVYDGSQLFLYRNGFLYQSLTASGTINSTTETFNIGNLLYSFTNFYLTGMTDETTLWNRALTSQEVECLFYSYVDTSSPGLQLYYDYNQGIAGGINLTENMLLPRTGSLQGTLNNFALTGNASNWVSGLDLYSHVDLTICPGDTLFYNNDTIYAPGNYVDSMYLLSGCLVLSAIHVTPAINDSVQVNGPSLTSLESDTNATFQWLDCNNGYSVVTGAIQQTIFPSDGTYAVQIQIGGCTDTSACYVVSGSGIKTSEVDDDIIVYSLPELINIVISSQGVGKQNYSAALFGISGNILKEIYSDGNEFSISTSGFAAGNYFLQITNEGRIWNRKIVIIR
jgi:hypothetical protein